jgi:hypothetical protein
LDALFRQSVFGGIRPLEDLFESFFCGLFAINQIELEAQNNHAQSKQFGEQEPRLLRATDGL